MINKNEEKKSKINILKNKIKVRRTQLFYL